MQLGGEVMRGLDFKLEFCSLYQIINQCTLQGAAPACLAWVWEDLLDDYVFQYSQFMASETKKYMGLGDGKAITCNHKNKGRFFLKKMVNYCVHTYRC